MCDPFSSADFDPLRDAEVAAFASYSPAEKEVLFKMLQGVRETNQISADPRRGRILGRLERAGLVMRFKLRGKHLAGLTEAGEALARELFPEPPKPKRASKSKGIA
jgi:hypothetical protein